MYVQTLGRIDTLLLSDTHLGSPVSRVDDLLNHIESFRLNKNQWAFDRLVLLGDIFDSLDLSRLDEASWQVISAFRDIADSDSNAELIWVHGNHDEDICHMIPSMTGLRVYSEFTWQVNSRRFIAMHGQQFDKWLTNYPRFSQIPAWFYEWIQQVDTPDQKISRFLKEKSKSWLKINLDVAHGVIDYISESGKNVDAVFCGHTHISETIEFPERNLAYFNTGCWTGKHPPTYITISHSGNVTIREFYGLEAAGIAPVPSCQRVA